MKQTRLVDFNTDIAMYKADIPNLPAEIKDRLITSFMEWLNKNSNLIDDRWKKRILKEIRKFRKMRATIPVVAGFAMWTLCIVNQLGVTSGIGIDGYTILDSTWERGFDKSTTEKLLLWVSEAVKLTHIPKEIAEQLGGG